MGVGYRREDDLEEGVLERGMYYHLYYIMP